MDQPKTLSAIMANPRRDECEARFHQLAEDLAAAGYTFRDIAHAGMTVAREVSLKEGFPFHRGFLGQMESVARTGIRTIDRMADRLAEIRLTSH